MNDLGQKIKTIREIKNLKQEYMAEQLHMSQPAYSKLEHLGNKIVYDRLEEIAEVFKMKPEQIINFDPTAILRQNENAPMPVGYFQEVTDENKDLKEKLKANNGLQITSSKKSILKKKMKKR